MKRGVINIESAAILFLCSKESKWITGLIMPVDGGVSFLFFAFLTIMVGKADLSFFPMQTTAGKADRPALKADTLAEQNTAIPKTN